MNQSLYLKCHALREAFVDLETMHLKGKLRLTPSERLILRLGIDKVDEHMKAAKEHRESDGFNYHLDMARSLLDEMGMREVISVDSEELNKCYGMLYAKDVG